MMTVLAAALVGLVSAFVPVTPAEPYLIAAAASGHGHPVVLGIAAALGQTTGKLGIFLVSRGAVRSAWLQRKIADRRVGRHRRRLTLPDRPWPSAAILGASATFGFPPLLAMTVLLGGTRMRPSVFTAICLTGRAARFVAAGYAPGLVGL